MVWQPFGLKRDTRVHPARRGPDLQGLRLQRAGAYYITTITSSISITTTTTTTTTTTATSYHHCYKYKYNKYMYSYDICEYHKTQGRKFGHAQLGAVPWLRDVGAASMYILHAIYYEMHYVLYTMYYM